MTVKTWLAFNQSLAAEMESGLASRLTQPDQKLMKSKEIEKKKVVEKLRVTLRTQTRTEEWKKFKMNKLVLDETISLFHVERLL